MPERAYVDDEYLPELGGAYLEDSYFLGLVAEGKNLRLNCLLALTAQLGRQRNWKDTGDLAMLFQGTFDTQLYRRVRDILHEEAETGISLHSAWDEIEERIDQHRSPRPISLAVGA
jgi:hypothetical protein